MSESQINEGEERSLEATLRPASLGEYIGQGEAKRSLTTLLQAARERARAAGYIAGAASSFPIGATSWGNPQ